MGRVFDSRSLLSFGLYLDRAQVSTSLSKKYLFSFRRIGIYSKIPLLRPPKMKTSYLLKTLFAKFKLFFSSFSTPSVPLIRDHLWDCSKGGRNIGILLYCVILVSRRRKHHCRDIANDNNLII